MLSWSIQCNSWTTHKSYNVMTCNWIENFISPKQKCWENWEFTKLLFVAVMCEWTILTESKCLTFIGSKTINIYSACFLVSSICKIVEYLKIAFEKRWNVLCGIVCIWMCVRVSVDMRSNSIISKLKHSDSIHNFQFLDTIKRRSSNIVVVPYVLKL